MSDVVERKIRIVLYLADTGGVAGQIAVRIEPPRIRFAVSASAPVSDRPIPMVTACQAVRTK
jgi:hypothetical protein